MYISFTDEQFLLNRVADAAIDIYGMVSVLSRASRAMEQNLSSGSVESTMCQVFCQQVMCLKIIFYVWCVFES